MSFFLGPSTLVLRSFGMSANNNPDYIPEVLDPQHRTFSTPNSRNFKEPVIQICTIFISKIHQHETWLGTGQSQIMTLFQWYAGEDSSLPRRYAEYMSVWFPKFFKTVLPSFSQSSSPLLKATQPITTSAATHPMTRLASQKTWLDTAVRTPNLTM
jgi:hypothetical protein